MFEKMSQSEGKVVGYKLIGTITKADYETLMPEVEALVKQEGTINMLLDLSQFRWEKINAWGSDWKFGREYYQKITKLAIVGDKKWEEWSTKLAEPFYAGEAKYFSADSVDEAWKWLN